MINYELLNQVLSYALVFFLFSILGLLGIFSYYVRQAVDELVIYFSKRKKKVDKSSSSEYNNK